VSGVFGGDPPVLYRRVSGVSCGDPPVLFGRVSGVLGAPARRSCGCTTPAAPRLSALVASYIPHS